MRHLAIVSFVTTAIIAAGAAPQTQTADQIIEKHLAALGGRAAIQKLTSRKTTGTATLSVQGQEIAGPYESYAKAPNKTRVVIKLDTVPLGGPGEMVIDQRFDGADGIVMNSMQGDTPISGNQLDNMRNGAFPSTLLVYKEKGVKIDVAPRETIGGKELIVLQVTPKAGSPAKVFLDPATYMITRTSAKVSSPDAGEFEQVIEFSDYRAVDGVKVAFQTVNTTPMQKVTTKLDKVEHNVAMDDAMFAKK
jgi:hypothetical protein